SGFTDPMVLSLAEFTALGRNHEQGNDALWDEMTGSRTAGDLAILVYTSGTTGPPKGAMHSNRSVTHQMRHANDLFPSTDAEERLVFLPLCHVAERVGGYYNSLALGSVMNFAKARRRCRTICARCSRPPSSRCRGCGKSSIPASPSR